jgi:hypothetical protein
MFSSNIRLRYEIVTTVIYSSKAFAIALMKGDRLKVKIVVVSLRRGNGLFGFEPDGLSSLESYAGEIQKFADKTSNDKRIDGGNALVLIWKDLVLEHINKSITKFTKILRAKVAGLNQFIMYSGQNSKNISEQKVHSF